MYTIARFRNWLSRRSLGFRHTDPLPVSAVEPRPQLNVLPLENRVLPGDILLAAVAGLQGLESLGHTPANVRTIDGPSVGTTEIKVGGRADAPVTLSNRVSVNPEMPATATPAKSGSVAFDLIALPGLDAAATDAAPFVRSFAAAHAGDFAVAVPDAVTLPSRVGVGAFAPAVAVLSASPIPTDAPLILAGRPAAAATTIAGQETPALPGETISITSGESRRVTVGASDLPRVGSPDVKGAAPRADFTYRIPGNTVGLNVVADRMAVQLTDTTGAGLTALTAAGGALEGATLVRWAHNTELAVLEGTGLGAKVAAVNDPAVEYAVPVYVDRATGTEIVIQNEVVVKLTDWQNADAFFAANGFDGYRPMIGTYDTFVGRVNGYGKPVLDAVAALQGADGVVYAEPNGYADLKLNFEPNDTEYAAGNMWHVKNTGQSGGVVGVDVNLTKAWDVNPGGAATMVYGIVDEGIDVAHEDLTVWVNPGETAGDLIDNDNNGFVDDINGWNFVNNNNSVAPAAATTHNHGTSVAGLVAAKGNNSLGVVGGAYKGQVMSVRIFEGGAATNDKIGSAILYGAGKTADGLGTWPAARLLNNSWGGATSAALNDALTWATATAHTGNGVPTFFSSGNTNAPALGPPQSQALTTPGMITVGMTGNDGLTSYSAYGAGLDIITVSDSDNAGTLTVNTTDRTGADGYATGNYTGTGATGFGGTSAASPIAAGVGGLVLSQAAALSVTMSAAQMDAYLKNNTDLVGVAQVGPYSTATGINERYGFGRLNAFDAVNNVGKAEVDVISATGKLASGATHDFGQGDINGTTTQTFRIRNGGTSALNLSNLAVTGAAYSVFTGIDDPTLTLGETATFTVKFSPTAAAATTGSATFTTNDANEGTYTINFTGTGKFVSIGGKTYEDWNGNGGLNTNDPGIAGRTVFIDANNNGTIDVTPNNFFNAPGLVVPDNTTVTTTATVSGLGGANVADVNVTLNIAMTWDADLNVFLISPAGTRVELFTGVGGSGDNFTNTVLDDEAATLISAGVAPFTGSFRPEGSLTAVDGQAAEGVWTLELSDTAGGDVATLTNWTLTIGTGEEQRLTDANGDYRFYGLAPATYIVRHVVPAGWTASSAAVVNVTVAANVSNVSTDFGSGFNNSFYTNVYTDANGNGSKQTTEAGFAGRRVFQDEDGDGVFDATGGNKTGTNSTPLTIPDGTSTFVLSDIVITGATPGGVADVDLTLNITHTWDADVAAFLIAPDGTFTLLFNGVGGNGDNFTNTTLDDEAATAIGSGVAPFTGSFRPQSLLSIFDGGPANGTWSLAVADTVATDAGTLTSWTIDIDLAERSVLTDGLGNAFVDLAAGGPYTFKLEQPAGFVYTAPVDGKFTVTAAGAPLFNNYYGVVVPPQVVGQPAVNGGAAQRSRVTTVAVTFNSPVTFTAGAFTFVRVGTYDGGTGDNKTITDGGASPQVTVTPSTNGLGNTVATLTFTGANGAVNSTSLADGVWRLTVDRTRVFLGTINPTADFVSPTTGANRIFRLFGDANGDGTVTFTPDYVPFDAAFGSSLGESNFSAIFDYNNDNSITFTGDYVPFDANFGLTM